MLLCLSLVYSGKGRKVKRREQFCFKQATNWMHNAAKEVFILSASLLLINQPRMSLECTISWQSQQREAVMAAGKTDGSCLSGPHSREWDRFYFLSNGRIAGLPGVCENKSAAARNEKWPWQDEELHFSSCLYTGLNGHKVRIVNPWRSKPLKSRWWYKPTKFQEATGQWGQALSSLVSVTQSSVSSIHILQNNCISTGKNHFKCPGPFKQAIREQSQLNWFHFFLSNKNHKRILGRGSISPSLKIHFALLQIRNFVQTSLMMEKRSLQQRYFQSTYSFSKN